MLISKRNYKTTQQGASLISVMTGLLISSIFIGGLLRMYGNYISSERLHEAQSALQDNGRFILSDLKRIIASAGLDLSYTDISNGVVGLSPTPDTEGGKKDTVVVSYKRAGGCSSEVSQTTTNTITNITVWINASNNLQCKHNVTGQAIANGVESLQVLYGVDTDSDNQPNRYIPSRLLTQENLADVRTVRIGLLVSSNEFTTNASNATKSNTTYQVLDESVIIPAGQNRLFRVYESTIFLRNMNSFLTGE